MYALPPLCLPFQLAVRYTYFLQKEMRVHYRLCVQVLKIQPSQGVELSTP